MITYKFKLYQSKKNKHLHQQIDIAGIVWNPNRFTFGSMSNLF